MLMQRLPIQFPNTLMSSTFQKILERFYTEIFECETTSLVTDFYSYIFHGVMYSADIMSRDYDYI